jgi:hypothetical protein
MHAHAPTALDQAGTTPGLLRLIADVAFGDMAVLREPSQVRRADDPVRNGEVADPDRAKEMFQLVRDTGL